MYKAKHIRNFVIVAHIDHGKSTLADRFLEVTETIENRKMKPQLLDQMDLERERGITIKMQPVRMHYTDKEQSYILNLIDTPGHIDFSYEVSRALAAVEGAILLVDATQGIQAQTLTNLYIALDQNLVVIPVLNKIDMKEARIDEVADELIQLLGVKRNEILSVSGKTGEGVEILLKEVIERVPPPLSAENISTMRSLIFDSTYESHKGIIAFVRVMEGSISRGDKVHLLATGVTTDIKEVGVLIPGRAPVSSLLAGEIGYIVTGLKKPTDVRIGDTVAINRSRQGGLPEGLPGYKDSRPMIWASFYPESQDNFDILEEALGRLKLNDASLTFEIESSSIMGRSFKCGFLGMLHLEIVTERLKREFNVPVITTSPSVAYEVTRSNGSIEIISSPIKFPTRDQIAKVREPWLLLDIIVPEVYMGEILTLVDRYEGIVVSTEPFGHRNETNMVSGGGSDTTTRLIIKCEVPLREIVSDFFDALKSVSSGYASMNYEDAGMRNADVERMDVCVAGDMVPALSRILSRKKLPFTARDTIKSLKEILPRQLFQVKIQALAEGRIIASESMTALKKDVTGYLYGGDRTRKMKLWKKQKEGKKKLKERGRVHIPSEVYLKIMKK